MQTDGGLIEDIEHAHQLRTDLRRQPDALRLAAGERAAGAVQSQVIQPHVDQKAESGAHFFEDLLADGLLAFVQRQAVEKFQSRLHGKSRDLLNAQIGDLDAARLGLQPQTVAGGTGHHVHEPLTIADAESVC